MNIYSFLIPIEESKLFLLVNVKSFLEKYKLQVILNFDDCYSKQFFFFPFTQCTCQNHRGNIECFKIICDDMKLNCDNILGYSYISNRKLDENKNYLFHVLLFKSVKLSDLNLIDLEYCLFPFDCDDNYLLLGPEVRSAIKNHTKDFDDNLKVNSSMLNTLPIDCFHEMSFKSIIDKVSQIEWIQMLFKKTSANIPEEVYKDYIRYSYPCYKMAYPQFLEFMIDQKIEKSDIMNYFRCFDLSSDGFISFTHFLIAVGCMDVNTVHGGQSGEWRSRYIFSFYDEDRDGFITAADIRRMLVDINKKKNKLFPEKSIDEALENAMRVFDINVNNLKINQDKFLMVVGNLLFRGTSALFRFLPDVSFSNRASKHRDKAHLSDSDIDITFEAIEKNDYALAVHSIKVHNQGNVINVRPIWEDIKDIRQLGDFGNKYNLTFNRLNSINSFNKESSPNEMIQALKYFRYPDPINNKTELNWGDVSMDCLSNYINILCDDVMSIVSKEPRIIELKSPAYVLGDLHGNYIDLMKFEETLWRLGIGLSPGNFLFLGDYVDRGQYGLEVIAYLFVQKILNPSQCFLLRGNHEIRSIQEQFTFKSECINKFGMETGLLVWNNINLVFDFLPVAAIIDDKLFCVHGGIPRPSLLQFQPSETDSMSSLKHAINSINVPLPDPERQSPLAWEIMWSDPDRYSKDIDNYDSESFNDTEDFGFKLNYRRRTAYCFNQSALENFLSRYNFSHVIRAHEVQKIGFNIELDAKLVTVFSSSHYCNNTNEAACVFVNNRKLRLIRLDTSDSD